MYRMFVWISLFFCLGMIVVLANWDMLTLILSAFFGVFFILAKKRRSSLLVFVLFVGLGMSYESGIQYLRHSAWQTFLHAGTHQQVVVIGHSSGYIKHTAWGLEMPFLIEYYLPANESKWVAAPPQSKVWLTMGTSKTGKSVMASAFANWQVTMRIKEPVPGVWAEALKRRGIGLVANASPNTVRNLAYENWADLYTWQGELQSWVEQRVLAAFGALSGGFLLSFAIGDRMQLEKVYVETFVALGIVHAVVASGATIRMTVAPVVKWLIKGVSLRFVWLFGGVSLTFMMVLLAGFAPPATRAALVYTYELVAVYLHKPRDFYTANVFSLVLLGAYEPEWLFDPGVIFSYAAATSIHILPNIFSGSLFSRIRQEKFRQLVSKAFSLEVGVTPFVAFEFGQIPYFSILISAFLYPVLEWVIPVSVVLLILACISPAGMQVLRLLLDPAFQLLAQELKTLTNVPLNIQFQPAPFWVQSAYLLLMSFSIWQIQRYKLRGIRKYLNR